MNGGQGQQIMDIISSIFGPHIAPHLSQRELLNVRLVGHWGLKMFAMGLPYVSIVVYSNGRPYDSTLEELEWLIGAKFLYLSDFNRAPLKASKVTRGAQYVHFVNCKYAAEEFPKMSTVTICKLDWGWRKRAKLVSVISCPVLRNAHVMGPNYHFGEYQRYCAINDIGEAKCTIEFADFRPNMFPSLPNNIRKIDLTKFEWTLKGAKRVLEGAQKVWIDGSKHIRYSILQEFPNLREIRIIGGAYLYGVDVEEFDHRIKKLNISYNSRLRDRHLRIMAKGTSGSLKVLDMNNFGRMFGPSMAHFKALRVLDVSHCKIPQAYFRYFEGIKEIDISRNEYVRDKALSWLSKALVVRMYGCRKVTDKGVLKLIKVRILGIADCNQVTIRGLRGLMELNVLRIGHHKEITTTDIDELKGRGVRVL